MEKLPEFVAAVDLGSNSFHMVVGRLSNGRLRVVDRMKEMVQLAAGLDANDCIDADARQRALDCLERFGQRLRHVDKRGVRAVGTNTLRKADNAALFLAEARRALGHHIEVIGGREEARLIYLGVAHNAADVAEQRLVIDIGGGSTEFIIGRRFTPLLMESLYMGCVSMSQRCFGDGHITEARMQRAELLAAQEIEPIQTPYRRAGWGHELGASGTIIAVRDALRAAGWGDDGISLAALRRLRARLIEVGHVERLGMPELQAQRARVFPGGVAILVAAFEALGLKRMQCSDGALREGLLYDLQGRLSHVDMREDTIGELMRRYQIDLEQASRVERTALALRAQVDREWRLRKDFFGNLLAWAARLHELGLAIAHSQYHKHGAYLLQNADLAGFTRQEQTLLAVLVRLHRRKFAVSALQMLETRWRERIERLGVLLRLAAVLHRSRADLEVPQLALRDDLKTLDLHFEPGWLAAHPLTQADLEQEAEYLGAAGYRLHIT